jgi:Fe-S-cluster containining protein
MKPNHAKSLLKQLYYRVDQKIDAMPKICQKGCFFCCYQPIEIFTIEKVLLSDYIRNQLSAETKSIIKENTLKWLDFFDANTSNNEPLTSEEAFVEFRRRAEHIPHPCPLLINGECSVYKVRPLNCRTHIVNDDKKICENNKLRNGLDDAFELRQLIVENLKVKMPLEVIPLPYALVEILGIVRRTKKIATSILT